MIIECSFCILQRIAVHMYTSPYMFMLFILFCVVSVLQYIEYEKLDLRNKSSNKS